MRTGSSRAVHWNLSTQSSDVLVVGAGIIGASIAWRLAQSGVRVTLVDTGVMGGEASWAGAGMLAPGGEFDRESPAARLSIESLVLYPAFVEQLTHESGMPVDFRITGAVEDAATPADWDTLVQRATVQQSLGIPCEVRAGSVFYPGDGLVDARAVVQALRRVCLDRAVCLLEKSPVANVDAGDYAAVVIAAGAWSSSVNVTVAGQRLTLPSAHPIKGHLIGYNLDPGSLPRILRRGHTYILQRSNGFTIAGSTTEVAGFDRTVRRDVCDEIHQRASQLWPCLADAAPAECWIGFRPATVTGDPALGRVVGANVWLAYGHYRNGILLAPVTARNIAADIISSLGTGLSSRASNPG